MTWWVLTLLYNSRAWTTLYTLAWTNRDAHLFMAWANYRPARQKVYRNVRGVQVHCGYRYIWHTPNITEQSESGNTYTHTFKLAALAPTHHVWYYLFSLAPDIARQCQGPLIHIEPPEIAMPSARVFHSTDQAIPISAATPVTFDSKLWDDGAFHDPAQPTRLTAPLEGLYSIGASITFASVAPAGFRLYLRRDDTEYIAQHSHQVDLPSWAGTSLTIETLYALDQGSYVQLIAYHDSALPRLIWSLAHWTPEFWIIRLGPKPA